MLIKWLQKSAIAICDLCNAAMFWIFSKPARIERFASSPLRFFLFPAIAISVLLNAIIESIHFAKTHNRNILHVTGLTSTIIGAIGAVVANAGGLITALFFNAGFPLGVYFILVGVGTGFLFHLSQSILKLTSFLLSPTYSPNLAEQKQNIASHLFYVGMLSSIFLGLLFTTLVPISSIFPALTITFFCLDCIWSALLSDNQKVSVKQFFGLTTPPVLSTPPSEQIALEVAKQSNINPSLLTFFQPTLKQDTVKAHLNSQNKEAATSFLLEEVNIKKQWIEQKTQKDPSDLKHNHKLTILNHIEAHLTTQTILDHDSLDELCSINYLAKQSFFSMAEGDMGDIIEATKLHIS